MSDKELAEKVVEVLGGTIVKLKSGHIVMDCPALDDGRWMGVKKFVRDFRIAGALLQRVFYFHGQINTETHLHYFSTIPRLGREASFDATNESLPRAIVEACAEALYES